MHVSTKCNLTGHPQTMDRLYSSYDVERTPLLFNLWCREGGRLTCRFWMLLILCSERSSHELPITMPNFFCQLRVGDVIGIAPEHKSEQPIATIKGHQPVYQTDTQTSFSDGHMKVSGQSVIGHVKPLPDGGPHYSVHSCRLAECCSLESDEQLL